MSLFSLFGVLCARVTRQPITSGWFAHLFSGESWGVFILKPASLCCSVGAQRIVGREWRWAAADTTGLRCDLEWLRRPPPPPPPPSPQGDSSPSGSTQAQEVTAKLSFGTKTLTGRRLRNTERGGVASEVQVRQKTWMVIIVYERMKQFVGVCLGGIGRTQEVIKRVDFYLWRSTSAPTPSAVIGWLLVSWYVGSTCFSSILVCVLSVHIKLLTVCYLWYTHCCFWEMKDHAVRKLSIQFGASVSVQLQRREGNFGVAEPVLPPAARLWRCLFPAHWSVCSSRCLKLAETFKISVLVA